MKITDETELVFETRGGSRYWIKRGKIRRLNPDFKKRGDGVWLTLHTRPEIEVGASVLLAMETLPGSDADVQVRTTSEVVGIDVLNEGVVVRTGKLKERQLKLIHKHPDGYPSPTKYFYAEAGEEVTWGGGRGNPEHYGGREILWCTLWSGESIGLTEDEVEWDEESN